MSVWLISTLLASSALMLLVLAIRRPVARHLGARAAYALWLLPALRMVLPPLPEGMTPVLPAHLNLVALLAPEAPAAAAPVDWRMIVLAAWLAIALLRFAAPFVAYRRFMRRALDRATLLRRERGVAVHLSGQLAGPLAAGVFARRIVLPRDFHQRFDAAEQALALHWWNPIAHVAWRAFRADQELACDAIVLAGADADARQAYGSALIKAAFGGTPAAACGMGRTSELKARLRAMRQGEGRPTLGAWLAAALVAGGLAGTATGGAAAEQVRAFGEQVRAVLPVADVPEPPRVPFAPEAPAAPRVPVTPRVIVDGVRYVPAVPAAPPRAPALPDLDLSLPPIPPMPPMPPLPPMPERLDAATRAEIRVAAIEVRQEARAALVEADVARREALVMAMEARREAMEAMAQARVQAWRDGDR